DSGEDSANNGSADLDGDPRKVGPATDIGADEFVPGQAPPPVTITPPAGGTGPVLTTTAQLFPGLRLGAVKFKVKGNKSFIVPITCPSFVTGNCVGTIVFVTASNVVVPKKATAAAKKKKVTIGKVSFSVPHG